MIPAAWVAALVVLGLAFGAELLRRFWPPMILRSPQAIQAVTDLAESEFRAKTSTLEVGRMKREVAILSGDVTLAERKLTELKTRHKTMDPSGPLITFDIGKPAEDQKLYEAYVLNRHLHFRTPPPDASRINPIWAKRRLVQVWSDNLLDARSLIDKAFPGDRGFDIDFRGEAKVPP